MVLLSTEGLLFLQRGKEERRGKEEGGIKGKVTC